MGAYITTAKIELTPSCNHRCHFCYNAERSQVELPYSAPSGLVTPELLAQTLKVLLEFGIDYFNFTGGEPLIRRDLLYSGMEFVRDAKRVISINSNAGLCTEQDAQNFREMNVYYFGTSVHSWSRDRFNSIAGSDSYDDVMRGIHNLLKYDVPVAVNVVVTSANVHHVRDTLLFLARDVGVTAVSATPIFPSTTDQVPLMITAEQIVAIADAMLEVHEQTGVPIKTLRPLPHCAFPDQPKYDVFRNGCSLETDEFTVTAAGDFKICASYHGIQGNILKRPMAELFADSRQLGFVRRAKYWEACRAKCSRFDLCEGGCPLETEILADAGRSHPYINRNNSITTRPVPQVHDVPGLLQKTIQFDPDTRFVEEESGSVSVFAFGRETQIDRCQLTCLRELARRVAEDADLRMWDYAMDLALDKNVFNLVLHHLEREGVLRFHEPAKTKEESWLGSV